MCVFQTADPYKGEEFKIEIELGEYPFKAPKITFLEPVIVHPNVEKSGKICFGILNPDKWKPGYQLKEILRSLVALVNEPDLENPVRAEIAELWKKKLWTELGSEQFRTRVKEINERKK